MQTNATFITTDIEDITRQNADYRRVLSTTSTSQLVLMSVPQGDTVKREIHPHTTQFLKVEAGYGILEVNGETYYLRPGSAAMISPGDEHFIKAMTGAEIHDLLFMDFVRSPGPLKMYLVYAPPEHPENTIQAHNPDIRRPLWD